MIKVKNIKELKQILKNKDFILYGAGFGGWLFVEYFCKKYKIFPSYIIDRKFKNKYYFLNNIPSINLDKFIKLYELKNANVIVIITVNKKKYLKEILNDLKVHNLKNFLILSKNI